MIEPGAKAALDQLLEQYKVQAKLIGDIYRIALEAGVPEVVAVDMAHFQAAEMGLAHKSCSDHGEEGGG